MMVVFKLLPCPLIVTVYTTGGSVINLLLLHKRGENLCEAEISVSTYIGIVVVCAQYLCFGLGPVRNRAVTLIRPLILTHVHPELVDNKYRDKYGVTRTSQRRA